MAEGMDAVHVQWKSASPEHATTISNEVALIAQDEVDFQHHKNGAYAKFQQDLLNIPAPDRHDVISGVHQKDNGQSLFEEFNDGLRITNPGLGLRSGDMLADYKVASNAVQSAFSKYDQSDDQTAALKQENSQFSQATQLADAFFRKNAPDTLRRISVDQIALDMVMTRQEQAAMTTDFDKISRMEAALKDANPEQFAAYTKMRDARTPVKERDRLHRELTVSQPDLVALRDSYNHRFEKNYNQIEAIGTDQQNLSLMSDLRFTAHANYAQALLEGNGSTEVAEAQTKLAFQDVPHDQFDNYAGNAHNWALLVAQGIKQEQIPNPDF